MKFYTAYIILLSFTLLAQPKSGEISFKILNKLVKDNDVIDLKIKNNTTKALYLPIIQNNISDKLSFQFENYFFLHVNVLDKNGKSIEWYNSDALGDCNELNELEKYWNYKKFNLSIKDFILLKPRESIKLKVSFKSVVKVCENVQWSIPNFKSLNQKYIQISYLSPYVSDLYRFLNKKNRKQLDNMDCRLYEKLIISNKVPLF